jgi:hypothetical protein
VDANSADHCRSRWYRFIRCIESITMQMSVFLFGVLIGGSILGGLARLIIPGGGRLTWAETTLVAIAGAAIGAVVANVFTPETGLTEFHLRTSVGVVGGAILAPAVANVLMVRFKVRQPTETRLDAVELLSIGESHRVEFKQTARWNMHTSQRDSKLELVVAKSVAGFLNADGGTLLIGIADDKTVVGLDDDLKLMKRPDLDRYELWLTDHLERCLGKPAVAGVSVMFELIEMNYVCRVETVPAPAPVFLDEPGGTRGADMYIRMGNSTRKLLTDEAFDYAKHRWP